MTVVQAIPKGDRAELAVEVLTEIGVDRIVPWAAARCVGVWRGERAAKSLAKWRATAREAGKQSRRSWLPEVTEMASTAEVVGLVAAADLAVVLHESATLSLSSLSLEGVSLDRRGGRPRGRHHRRGAGGVRCRVTSYGWGSRCCAPRRPAWPPSPRCSHAPSAGAEPSRKSSTFSAGISHGLSTSSPSSR